MQVGRSVQTLRTAMQVGRSIQTLRTAMRVGRSVQTLRTAMQAGLAFLPAKSVFLPLGGFNRFKPAKSGRKWQK